VRVFGFACECNRQATARQVRKEGRSHGLSGGRMETLEFMLIALLLGIGFLGVMVIAVWLLNRPSERARAARRR